MLKCSNDCYLCCELQHIKKVFHEQNNYPIWVINKVFKELQSKQHETTLIVNDNEERNSNVKNYLLILPYKGLDITSLRKSKLFVLFLIRSLVRFNMIHKTIFNHKHDIAYYAKCPEESCPHDYAGESGRGVLERVKDHNGKDAFSYIFKHCIAVDHQFVFCDNLRIAVRNYRNNKQKQKIAKVLLIKNLKLSLNVQEKSVALLLFNELRSLDAPRRMSFNCIYRVFQKKAAPNIN